jgi:serine/threonine protein kinase
MENCPQDGSPLEFLLKPGDRLVGPYRFEGNLGAGGMGIVFRASHDILKRMVAIKMLLASELDASSLQRFQREARAISYLHHPNIVDLLEFGIDPNDNPFMVMEYVDGVCLSKIIAKAGHMEPAFALRIMLQICSAMKHAHASGIVHRDLKPSNILIVMDEEGRESVKILDFGIAKLTNQPGFNDATLTRTGEVFGSPKYMSPEQVQGKPTDARTDIYSAGLILYEMLTGSLPFTAETTVELLVKKVTCQPPSLKEAAGGRDFPKNIQDLITKALQNDPEERFATFDALATDLQACLDKPAISTGKETLLKNGTLGLLTVAIILSLFFLGKSFLDNQNDGKQVLDNQASSDPDIERIKNLTHQKVKYAQVSEDPDSLYNLYLQKPTPDAVLQAYVSEASRHEGDLTLRDVGIISDSGMAVLRKAKSLRRISIIHNKMGDRIFDAIEGLPLIYLNLSDSGCTPNGLMRLSKMPTLRSVVLDYIDLHASPAVPTEKLFAILKNLNELSVMQCGLTNEDIAQIAKIKDLRSLNIGKNGKLTDACIPSIEALPKLTDLDICICPEISAHALAKSSFLPRLTSLDLSVTTFSNIELREIADKAKSLEHLSMSYSEVTDQGLLAFSNVKKLSDVTITHCPRISAQAIAEFKKKLSSCSIISKER